MKKITLTLIINLICFVSTAQEPLRFVDLLNFDGISKDDIFTATQTWMAEKFDGNNNQNNISLNREGGVCVIKFATPYKHEKRAINDRAWGQIASMVKVEIKDGRVRYTHSEFEHIGDNPFYPSSGYLHTGEWIKDDNKWRIELWADLQNKVKLLHELMLESYKSFISKTSTDW